jgi:hypothetical protein
MPGLDPGIHHLQKTLARGWIAGSSPAMTNANYFGARFTAASRSAFAEPGRSGLRWLSYGAQPDSQITSKVVRMRPSESAKRRY